MNNNPLAHPEQWSDYIMIVPKRKPSICDKCINKKMKPSTCPGVDKCDLTKK